MLLLRMIILVSLFFIQIVAQDKQLTVSGLYSDPGLSNKLYMEKNFSWTPDGKCITYFEDTDDNQIAMLCMNARSKAIDTIFVSSQLRWIEENDTIELSPKSYQWSPFGDELLFKGRNDLFIYDIENKILNRITTDNKEKADVKFSPDGKFLSYIKNHNIYITKVENKKEFQLTKDGEENLLNGELDWVYPEELGIRSGYQWSPDSKSIAFLQMDESNVSKFPIPDWTEPHPETYWEYYPKAGCPNPEVNVGIATVPEGEIVWVKIPDSDVEYIPRFDWLPDSSKLAIQTLNRGQNHLMLHFSDPSTGECKLILEEKDSYWLNIESLYYFFKDRKNFIWYSERDGFMHLYLYDYEGNKIKQLTSGEWCVTTLNGVDEKRGLLYFCATKKSILERHIYSVSLKNGKIKLLDKGSGTHSAKFSTLYHYFIEYFTRHDIPTRVYLSSVKGKRVKLLFKNEDFDKKKYGFGKTKFIKLTAEDGTILSGSLLYPKKFDSKKKYPVLIYVYGGPHAQVVRNSFVSTWHQLLTQRGYLVFSVDNRGSFGRGRDWERKIYLQMGKYELQDQLEGVKYLKNLDYVDPDRIGIWGWSYGGYMTLYALCKAPEEFKTGISVAPVTHWKYYDTIYTERYMRLPNENQQGYFDGSPLNFVSQIEDNFLLVHGLADDNVHFQQSAVFIDELIKHNKKFQLMTYPGRKHGIRDKQARIHLFEMMTEFIEENL